MDEKNQPLFRNYKSGALLGFGLSTAGSIVVGLESYFAPGTLFTSPEIKNVPLNTLVLGAAIAIPAFTLVGALAGYVNDKYLFPGINYVFDKISSRIP